MKPLTEVGFRQIMGQITRLKRTNKDLRTRVAQLEASRAKWRTLALERSKVIQNQRRQLRRWKARAPEWRSPPRKPKVYYTPEQYIYCCALIDGRRKRKPVPIWETAGCWFCSHCKQRVKSVSE